VTGVQTCALPISKIIKFPTRIGDVKKTHADISKIKNLGFNYEIDLIKGIKMTYEWYKKNM
jgi:nucleoside-diphosphate-sugar epimerase